jgi:hypothetical protein
MLRANEASPTGLAVVEIPNREKTDLRTADSKSRAKASSAPDKKSIPEPPFPNFSASEVFQEELPSSFFHSKRCSVLQGYGLTQRDAAFVSLSRDRGRYINRGEIGN